MVTARIGKNAHASSCSSMAVVYELMRGCVTKTNAICALVYVCEGAFYLYGMCAFGFSLSIVINSASPFHFSFLSGSDHAAFSSVMTMGTRKTTTTITFTYQKEWRVCLGMSSLAPSPRPSQAYMTSAWPLWLVVIALLVTCELGHGQHSFQSDSSVCSSTFNVWKPEQDVLRRLEVTQLQIQNLSSFCQALVSKQSLLCQLSVTTQHSIIFGPNHGDCAQFQINMSHVVTNS